MQMTNESIFQIFARHRPTMPFNGVIPFQTNDTFIAPTASVIGNVTNWDQSSVWYKAVVRADNRYNNSITIGFCSSIGEASVVQTVASSPAAGGILVETGLPADTHIGHYVTVGAGCVLKSCRIDDLVIVGDKCVICEGSLVDNHVILEAGTVVLPYQHIPAGQKWGGNPAVYISDLTAEEKEGIQAKALKIHEMAKDHIVEFLPHGYTYVHLEELEKTAAAKLG
jgi:gamma-carbonic anhydrase